MKHETMIALVVSTAHVTKDEALSFDCGDANGPFGPSLGGDYGWLIYAGTEDSAYDEEDLNLLSDGLRGVIEYAWSEGLEWVRFDRDGQVLPGVTTYDW